MSKFRCFEIPVTPEITSARDKRTEQAGERHQEALLTF